MIQKPDASCEFHVVDDEMPLVRHRSTPVAVHDADQVFRTTNSADRTDWPANREVGIWYSRRLVSLGWQ